jgi:ribosomal protein S6--L-glutamate ligase
MAPASLPPDPSKLRIGILSANPRSYSIRRLVEAGRARGHRMHVLEPTEFSILVEADKPSLFYRDAPAKQLDAVIPRIGASITFFGTAVVRQFEQMGVYCLNTADAISRSRDKLRSVQLLSRHKIGLPKTAFVKSRDVLHAAISHVDGAPLIIKLLEGTQGIGVILAEHAKTAEAIVETLNATKQNVLLQKFIKESRGRDIRAFVVGGKVVAAMRRVAQGDEFRSNVHRGARAEPVELDAEYERAAVRAAQVMGLNVAGVDMLEGHDGCNVMEVNSSPGLEGIEGATHVDVAAKIIEHVEREVRYPEVDVRQRLALSHDHAVMEFAVDADSSLAGKSLESLALRERDIVVLSVTRGADVIAVPRGGQVIQPGDVLLCFGSTDELRHLAPQKKRKRAKSVAPASIVERDRE